MNRLDEIIGKIEKYLLSLLLSLMIVLAFIQILLRNLFSTGLPWADFSVRYLVLWIGFIGASLAVREGKHITIDLFSHWMKGAGILAVDCVANLFSAFVCAVLTVAALIFVWNEAQMSGISPLGFPSWMLQSILPIACALMSARFIRGSFRAFSAFYKPYPKDGTRKDTCIL